MECSCDYIFPMNDVTAEHYDNCASITQDQSGVCRNEDGSIRLRNEHLKSLNNDVLYHLGLDTTSYDLPAMFGDVKFVCMGGTKYRMREFARYMAKVLGINHEVTLPNLTKHSHRYAMYKIGPVLSVSHGIGIPSMTIVLQEVMKLMAYSKAKDPMFFRIGTSGGLGIPPGSVVISCWGLNGTLEKTYDIPILGKVHRIPAYFDKRLSQELFELVREEDGFDSFIGGTMAADDFYRGQGRLDGPFCGYSEADKLDYLKTLVEMGVRNIEMEATAFAALTSEAGVRAADLCVTYLDRLLGDQVTPNKSTLLEWQMRPMVVLGRYIAHYCNNSTQTAV